MIGSKLFGRKRSVCLGIALYSAEELLCLTMVHRDEMSTALFGAGKVIGVKKELTFVGTVLPDELQS